MFVEFGVSAPLQSVSVLLNNKHMNVFAYLFIFGVLFIFFPVAE